MKIYVQAFVITILVGALFVFGFQKWREASSPKAAEARIMSIEQMEKDGIPNFSYTTLQGEKGELRDLRGKTIILNFWASWCGPCVEEFPSMISLVEALKGEAVLVAVSGDSSRTDIDQFLKQLKGWDQRDVKIVWDEDRSLSNLYDVDRLPESYIANANHNLVKKIIGSINWHTPESVEYMKSISGR
ncbi:MAG: redoxin domain-containing protein [Bdellovibrio sp.]|jgi:cytochrome c biogenesis protein CcmG/thiol:disulfide interchange protein DsbE